MRIPTPDREGEVKIVSCTSSVARMEKSLKKKKLHVITHEKTTNVYCKVIFYSENIYILYSGI